jgi:hypothetical protein
MKPELPVTIMNIFQVALRFIKNKRGGVPHRWSQTPGSGPPKQLTDFKVNSVWQRAWSRDSKWLALGRGRVTKDVVLIKDFR